ncbi:hypothetical protein EON63_15520 [archaeon]|nr:MAG: hypothetical protein EON63_15520 [archaeon]
MKVRGFEIWRMINVVCLRNITLGVCNTSCTFNIGRTTAWRRSLRKEPHTVPGKITLAVLGKYATYHNTHPNIYVHNNTYTFVSMCISRTHASFNIHICVM